jgi:hypothetical protein
MDFAAKVEAVAFRVVMDSPAPVRAALVGGTAAEIAGVGTAVALLEMTEGRTVRPESIV